MGNVSRVSVADLISRTPRRLFAHVLHLLGDSPHGFAPSGTRGSGWCCPSFMRYHLRLYDSPGEVCCCKAETHSKQTWGTRILDILPIWSKMQVWHLSHITKKVEHRAWYDTWCNHDTSTLYDALGDIGWYNLICLCSLKNIKNT